MNRRVQILFHWLRGRRHGVDLRELLAFLVRPTIGPRARRMIRDIEESGNNLIVRFEAIERPLLWPREFPLTNLYQVISEAFYPDDWHFYEVAETRVRPGDTVVDCGAAEGLFTLLAARRARKVYAIEPHPLFVAALRGTFLGVSNVEIVPRALDEKLGTARICTSGIASAIGKGGSGIEVDVTTLDELFGDGREVVSYIKADLEGYDVAMLRGAADLISRHRPRIAITTYHQKDHATQIEILLRRLWPGYKIRCKGIFQGSGSPVMLHAWAD